MRVDFNQYKIKFSVFSFVNSAQDAAIALLSIYDKSIHKKSTLEQEDKYLSGVKNMENGSLWQIWIYFVRYLCIYMLEEKIFFFQNVVKSLEIYP